MSEQLAFIRKKGGGGADTIERVLWENPSPNTRLPASDSTQSVSVTLSDALSNYDYVKFVFKRNNTAYADMYSDVIYSVEEFKKFTVTAYSFRGAVSCFTSATSNMVARRFSYEDDTTVRFIHAVSGTNASGSVTQAIFDETLIPNQIIGIKMTTADTQLTEQELWVNPSPTSSFPNTDVILSENIDNFEYIRIYFRESTTSSTERSYIYPASEMRQSNSAFGGKFNFANTTIRPVSVASGTKLSIYTTYQATQSSQTTTNTGVIPTKIVGIKKIPIKKITTVKDYIYDKVFNSNLPEVCPITTYGSPVRATINEGGIVYDSALHRVYMYVDFTMNTSYTGTSSWYILTSFTSAIVNYTPMYVTNSRATNMPLITDESSSVPSKQFAYGYATTDYPYHIFLPYGVTINAGEHYIVYLEYTYK